MDMFAIRRGERIGTWWREVDAELGESDSDEEGPRVDRDPTDNHIEKQAQVRAGLICVSSMLIQSFGCCG